MALEVGIVGDLVRRVDWGSSCLIEVRFPDNDKDTATNKQQEYEQNDKPSTERHRTAEQGHYTAPLRYLTQTIMNHGLILC